MTRAEALAWGRGDFGRRTTKEFPLSVRHLVTNRMGYRCRHCEVPGSTAQPLELDHLQPLSKGGDNHHSNLAWSCVSCNRGRGNRKRAPRFPAWRRRLPR